MKRSLAVPTLSPTAVKGGLVALAAALLLCVLAILPYFWHAQLRSQAAAHKAELALVKAKAHARANAGGPALTEADDLASMFLPGSTAGTTLAAFQSLVNEQAGASGLSVLRMQPLPTDETAGLSPFRLAVEASGSLEQLQSFLVSVEAMLPIVIVTGFEIQPRAPEGAGSQPYPSEDLAVSLRVEAYAWRVAP
jgi:hypothetical protein